MINSIGRKFDPNVAGYYGEAEIPLRHFVFIGSHK
jgi:hypothetical protein